MTDGDLVFNSRWISTEMLIMYTMHTKHEPAASVPRHHTSQGTLPDCNLVRNYGVLETDGVVVEEGVVVQ